MNKQTLEQITRILTTIVQNLAEAETKYKAETEIKGRALVTSPPPDLPEDKLLKLR